MAANTADPPSALGSQKTRKLPVRHHFTVRGDAESPGERARGDHSGCQPPHPRRRSVSARAVRRGDDRDQDEGTNHTQWCPQLNGEIAHGSSRRGDREHRRAGSLDPPRGVQADDTDHQSDRDPQPPRGVQQAQCLETVELTVNRLVGGTASTPMWGVAEFVQWCHACPRSATRPITTVATNTAIAVAMARNWRVMAK